MAWYRAGTVGVTNGSKTVTGSGTAFTSNVQQGDAIRLPDGKLYEIATVDSSTSLTLVLNYAGSTASAQTHEVIPVRGYIRDLAQNAASLLVTYQGFADRLATVEDGKLSLAGGALTGGLSGTTATFTGNAFLATSSGNVGIGTSSPGTKLSVVGQIHSSAGLSLAADSSTFSYGGTSLPNYGLGALSAKVTLAGFGGLSLFTNQTERLTVTQTGNVGIGTAAPISLLDVNGGVRAHTYTVGPISNYYISANIGTGNPGINFDTNDFIDFDRANDSFRIGIGGSTKLMIGSGGNLRPVTDNAGSLGIASERWATVYAATGAINTSDARAKHNVSGVPEEWLDAWGAVEWKRYKFIDAVEQKGESARWHLGLVAQRVMDTFADHGLDALKIGLLCYDEWDEVAEPVHASVTKTRRVLRPTGKMLLTEPPQPEMEEVVEDYEEQVPTGETKVTREAGNRFGLRYDECFAIEAAWQRRRMAQMESRLNTLEEAA